MDAKGAGPGNLREEREGGCVFLEGITMRGTARLLRSPGRCKRTRRYKENWVENVKKGKIDRCVRTNSFQTLLERDA